jgi:hypothetical protein
MIQIGGLTLDCFATYTANESGANVEVFVPNEINLSDDDIVAMKNATSIEQIEKNFGVVGNVVAEYSLVCWQSVVKRPTGIWFTWQTYRTTDIEQIKQDNEDLTQALLELAQIVGGDNG